MTIAPTHDDAAAELVSLRGALRQLESAQRQLRSTVSAESGLAVSELTALEAVADMPDLTPKMLGLELSLTTGAVTALIDRMESGGHLTRVPNPRDRRSVLLRLGPTGEQVLAAVTERYDAVVRGVVQASPALATPDVAEDLARAAAVITAHTIR